MKKMPVLFVGHGSPLNAIEENKYSLAWGHLADSIPKPKAILAISAHWYTEGTRVSTAAEPKQIYDMYGFPEALYQVKYPVKGAPELAQHTQNLLTRDVVADNTWGIDHGSWSILHRAYPKADIPVYQLSVNRAASAAEHFQMGQELKALREKDVLILCSGNVVHNLARVDWNMEKGYDWADEFDGYIKDKVQAGDYEAVIEYQKAGKIAQMSFSTPEHFYPLLYALGAADETDKVSVFNEGSTMGALSMTSYVFG